MAHIQLITGGCRSGKSGHALALSDVAGGVAARRVFIATMPVIDDEMRRRVDRHRREREAGGWVTIEEQVDLLGALTRAAPFDVAIVDCLTLWVNNLLYHAEQTGGAGREIGEDGVAALASALIAGCRALPGAGAGAGAGTGAAHIIFVTNELGMGIVPENALARRFRDLAGRCNQVVAREADAVTFMCCGIPLELKHG